MEGTKPTTDAVWSQLSGDLWRFIRRRVPDDHVADDLHQETFLRIHRKIDSLGGADRLAAWVYRIARNVVHDHYRSRGNGEAALGETEPADEPGDELAELRCRGVRRVVVGTANAGIGQLAYYQKAGFRLLRIERDFFSPARGYPAVMEDNGIRLRDMVWMDLELS